MRNIISIIFIIASIASFILVTQPQYQEIQALRDRQGELDEVLANARRLQSLRDDLLGKERSFEQTELDRLQKMVPESVDNVKLILELQRIADQYNLEIQTASTDQEAELADAEAADSGQGSFVDIQTRDYGVISLDFTIIGEYSNFLEFLRDLESNLRITDVRALSLAPGESGNFNFQITLETYWLKDNI